MIPNAVATATPSRTSAVISARVAGSSHRRPCVRPVSAPSGLLAALKISFVHCAPRASASALVAIPPRVIASARRSTSSSDAGRPSNGPIQVSPPVSICTTPGAITRPAGKVVPRITRSTRSAISSSFPTPFWTLHTAPSVKIAAAAAIAAR